MNGDFFFLSGKSIDEPIVMGGPFVMNSQQEQAYQDLVSGYFN
jgi:redox-sensitive bicupin YhaK (pirin superfamily)